VGWTDQKGILQYRHLVKEVANEPDYKAVLMELKKLMPQS
jgi:hypothetical protein